MQTDSKAVDFFCCGLHSAGFLKILSMTSGDLIFAYQGMDALF